MKKLLMLLLLSFVMCGCLWACGDEDSDEDEGSSSRKPKATVEVEATNTPTEEPEPTKALAPTETPTPIPTETPAPTPTEEPTPTPTEAPKVETNDPSELGLADTYVKMENVWYDLAGVWKEYSDFMGTKVYRYGDSEEETFSIYVQKEKLYTKDMMITAYERQIMKVYGDNVTASTITTECPADNEAFSTEPLEWNVYSYGTDNALSSQVEVTIYLYSDGETTIYIENAQAAGSEKTDVGRKLVESVIKEK